MRIFRLIATPVLLLGLLAFLVWGAFWGWRNLTAPLPTPEPTPCVTVTTEFVTVADVSVRIYNGGFTSGLARRQASRLEDAGFNVIRVGNTDERVSGTVVRGNADNVPAQRLIMSYFLDVTFEDDERVDGTVDVLLGSDFGGETPPEEQFFRVSSGDGGTICVPPSPEPTGSAAASPTATTES